jgi:acetyl esterase/lipase
VTDGIASTSANRPTSWLSRSPGAPSSRPAGRWRSDAEIVRDDAVRLVERGSPAGVDAALGIWAEVSHVFQGFAGVFPEADDAIEHICLWVRSTLRR